MSHRSLGIALALAALIAPAGCSKHDMPNLTGNVTVDGAPVADGAIRFEPVDGRAPTAGGIIHDGRYSLAMEPGVKLVRIEAFRVVGERPLNRNDPNGAKISSKQQILPEKFNTQSTLRFEFDPATKEKNFDLKSHE